MTARPLPARLSPRATLPTLRDVAGCLAGAGVGLALVLVVAVLATAIALLPGALFTVAVCAVATTAVALIPVGVRRVRAAR